MKEYQIQIKETLVKTVTVEAESTAQARELVERQWKNSDHILFRRRPFSRRYFYGSGAVRTGAVTRF